MLLVCTVAPRAAEASADHALVCRVPSTTAFFDFTSAFSLCRVRCVLRRRGGRLRLPVHRRRDQLQARCGVQQHALMSPAGQNTGSLLHLPQHRLVQRPHWVVHFTIRLCQHDLLPLTALHAPHAGTSFPLSHSLPMLETSADCSLGRSYMSIGGAPLICPI